MLAERGYAVIDDVLSPATVLNPILDTMARHIPDAQSDHN